MSTDELPHGLAKGRVETLADGVFAIAMTILVLGLQVPESSAAPQLRARLYALWPKLASYALSFVMLGVLWIGHHYQMHYIRRTNRALIWLNLIFLLAITFLPFSTALLGNCYREPLAIAVYGGTVIVAGAFLLLHWLYALRGMVASDLHPSVARLLAARIIFGLALSALAICLGFLDTRLSLVVFLSMPLVYLIRSRVDRHTSD